MHQAIQQHAAAHIHLEVRVLQHISTRGALGRVPRKTHVHEIWEEGGGGGKTHVHEVWGGGGGSEMHVNEVWEGRGGVEVYVTGVQHLAHPTTRDARVMPVASR